MAIKQELKAILFCLNFVDMVIAYLKNIYGIMIILWTVILSEVVPY